MSQENAKQIPKDERCDVCRGEGIVAYMQSRGGFSEPANCYKCGGTGRLTPILLQDRG
jgi:DnaJ-class molecular chaperone